MTLSRGHPLGAVKNESALFRQKKPLEAIFGNTCWYFLVFGVAAAFFGSSLASWLPYLGYALLGVGILFRLGVNVLYTFLQAFVNFEVNRRSGLTRRSWPIALVRRLYGLVWKQMERYNRAGRRHPGFTPFNDVYAEAAEARSVISLNAQFGEGWLLPAEVLSLARQGVDHVVSLQPFGCIANHIVAKGVEKRIKELHPDIHFLSLDFDSGVSDVNVLNRLLLFAHSLKEPA